MNNQFRCKKQIMSLMEMIAMAGELPAKSIGRFPGSEKYNRKCVTEAQKMKFVRYHRKDHLSGLRLTAKGKQILLERSSERFHFFLSAGLDMSRVPSGAQKRMRLHRSAEAYLMMRNTGTEIFRDRKPLYFSGERLPPVPFPAYYGSREMKELGAESAKVKNSRAVGVLLTPERIFAVYNTGSGHIKWYGQAEERLAFVLPRLLKQVGAFPLGLEFETSGIMLADSMSRFHQFLDETDRKAAFPVDNGQFWNMHWIPDSVEGEAVLRLLCDRSKREEFHDALRGNFSTPPAAKQNMELDAIGNRGEPVLFAYDLNAPRIRRFAALLQLRHGAGIVVCFDFQREIVERLSGGIAKVLVIDLETARKTFDF